MSKKGKALAATAAVAAGPSGIKRLLAGCLMVILLGGLALGGLLGFAAWSAQNAERAPESLPCPPSTVAVAMSTRDAPPEVRAAVEQALRDAGREPVAGGWGDGLERDLVIAWSPGSATRVSAGSNPTTLTLGAVPTAAEVAEVLGDRLAPCEPAPAQNNAPASTGSRLPAQETADASSWPWERGWTTTGWLALMLTVWWLAGPNIARWTWAALWPLRLGWRVSQRAAYRRGLRRGVLPSEWPERLRPAQRWHEDREALHDPRPYRQQIAESETERRPAMRNARRAERLEGVGIGPASFWRLVYREPAPEGAPERNEVLT